MGYSNSIETVSHRRPDIGIRLCGVNNAVAPVNLSGVAGELKRLLEEVIDFLHVIQREGLHASVAHLHAPCGQKVGRQLHVIAVGIECRIIAKLQASRQVVASIKTSLEKEVPEGKG